MNLRRRRQMFALDAFLCLAVVIGTQMQTAAQSAPARRHKSDIKEFSKWPKGSSPEEIGKRVAEHFAAGPHTNFGKSTPPKLITYPETCTWYGSLTFAQLSGDKDLTAKLVDRFEPLFSTDSNLIPVPKNVDSTVFAAVPFELYIEMKQEKYLDVGKSMADKQWEETTADGISKQARYWIDDMYMMTMAQLQAYRATGDQKYLDRAALAMTAYLDKLQQSNGLFYHAPDVPFYWGRGNGWVAAGMAEMLRSLPENHPQRARILDGYRKMMKSLLQYQGKDGMWRQLIDHPESWPESSSTGMFTFAMITGVKNGWLERKTYASGARKGWLGLVSYLEPNGDIRNVCEGTNKRNDYNYYMNRPRLTGDLHGQAPILWSASALLR